MPLKSWFYLTPDIAFLNHGSFGATPTPVLEAQSSWQKRLEVQPVAFLGREIMGYLEEARIVLGNYLHAPADALAYLPNVTYGLNLVARSLALVAGDEILTTNHEYGACDFIWDFIAQKTGARIVRQKFELPLGEPDAFIQKLWDLVRPETRVISLSHVTSPTAQIFPVASICQRAREAGILTVIDGAHAPGQVPLDLRSIDPDIYLGNCHKWMLGPKGSGFIYTRPDIQPLIEPLVVSWGWGQELQQATGSRYLDLLQWSGTQNPAPYLAVPDAIKFQEAHDWPGVRDACQNLLTQTLEDLNALTGLPPAYQAGLHGFSQMAVSPLPAIRDPISLQADLYRLHKVEIPVISWGGGQYIRISIQGYNSRSDTGRLVEGLRDLLPRHRVS